MRITGQLVGKTLSLAVTCNRSNVTAFDGGAWGPVVRRRQIAVPYYTGGIQFLPQENLFVNAQLDWTAAAASSHHGAKAAYDPLTDGTRGLLSERLLFTAAWHLAEVLPNPPNPPSPWRHSLANKVVLDIWGGRFTNIANNLEALAGYGITNCVALIHDWQRSGYDNALPMHYPANAAYGGDAGMRSLVATGTRTQTPVSLFPTPSSTPSSGSVVLVGVGDISSGGQNNYEATAKLLDGISGTVFTAGDNTYNNGT